MYILQFVNTFTQEILREETYKKPDTIESIIQSFTIDSGLGSFLLDSQMRLLKAEYISHKIYIDRNDKIYKLFFKVQKVEAKLKR